MKRLVDFRYIVLLLILILPKCGVNYNYPYDEQIGKITDEEIENYLGAICLELGGHIGLTAIGRCGQCGGMTPCCNMQICGACAGAQGVCPFCLKKVDWTKNTDPETEVPLLLAVLVRSNNLKARQIAIHALTQIKDPETIETMMRYSNEKMLSKELAVAVGVFKDARYVGFLKKVLHYAGNDYFGDDEDIETQYYLSYAAQAAAQSLAQIGNRRALDVLFKSAKKGKLWERYYAIGALGNTEDARAKQTLISCLKEFFAKDEEWKWIPGRDLIGATLKSLAKIGDRETALLVIYYIRNPGCDFLYEDLRQCLASIGKPAVPELIAAIDEDFNNNLYDWGRQILVEALGDIGDSRAVPFLIEMLNATYPDQWSERDFKGMALKGLGKLRAKEALNHIAHELVHGKDESTRQSAAHALGQIGSSQAFRILEDKLKQSDTKWVVRECLASLNSIAFHEINTDEVKLKATTITADKGSFESAFQLMYQPLLDGEAWGIDFFFEILDKIPMQRNFYNIVELLNTNNKKIFEKTITFLKRLTKLKVKAKFNDPPEKKAEVTQKLFTWFQQNYQSLK